uniref:ABC-type glutathione-S-conjugate transporter n=1 Tax=Strigamia maritima TaxID=126957 RepID=T1J4L1_STRMM
MCKMGTLLDAHCGSSFWDWSVVWETDNPDFTDCFQKTVLIWIPCGFLWICLPFEIYSVKKHRRRCIPWSPLNSMKLILNFCLSVLALTEMFYWVSAREWMDVASVNYYSTFIKSLTFMFSTMLILYHRIKGRRSSGVLFLFWLLLTLSATVTFRTFMISGLNKDEVLPAPSIFLFVCCVVAYPLIVVQLLLSTISDKISPESIEGKNECPIVNATLLSCYLFSWFDKMAYLGFRRPLTKDDLWDLLSQYRCSYNFPKFNKNWQLISKKQILAGKTPSPSVLSALGRTFWIPFVLTGLAQFGANVTDFTTPFALRFLIDFVSSDEPSWRGYLYCCLIMFMGIMAAFFYTQQYWIAFRMGMQLRASIISAIYRKALRMNSNIKSSSSTGEIVNLMSIDTEHLHDVIPEFHTCWVGILQISVCFYLLWNELGISTLASLATLGLMIPINGYIASRLQQVQIKQMKFKDHRVKLMNEILAGIKVLKLYAWENSFGFQLSAVRNKELQMLKKNAYLTAVVEFMFGNLPILVALSTFVTYTLIDENNVLDAKKVFVSISLFNIMHYPLIIVPMMIVGVVQALVSTTRLNKFLNQEELDPHAVSHDIAAKNAIDIENGTFSWTSNGDPILSGINLTCPPGHLVAVLGPVGCGKSSLLSAVLGEMEKRNGHLNTKGTIAYVAQQAWIQNVTLRDNITFGLEYDKQRYDKVIEACALTPDLELLPGGDQTEIGERGINLSGGQKQRVSLARSVYSNADIILLDDPLSAVDSHVGKHIFNQVIGPNGLLRKKSRLFITNSIAHLQQVDTIVVLDKGQVTEVGSYDQLLQNKGAFAEFLLNYLSEHDAALLNEDELINLGCIREEVARLTSIESDSSVVKSLGPSSPLPKSPGVRSFTSDVGDSSMPFSFTKRMSRSLSQESHVYKRHLSQDNSKPEKSFSEQQNTANIIELETAETGQVSRQIYMKYFRAVGLSIIIVCFAAFALSTSCGVAANTWLSVWSQDPPTSTMDLRIQRLTVYGALGIGQVTLLLIGCLALANGSVRASRNLHNSMLNNILRCPLSFFDTTPLGRILNRFSKDMDLVDGELAQNIYPMLGTFLETIAIIIVVTMSTPLILSVILPVFVIYYLVQRFYISSSRQLKRLSFISHSPIFSHFSETLFGTSTIRAYNRTADFSRENERLVDEYHKCDFPSLVANRWLGIRLQLLGSFVSFSAALFAVIAKDTVDPGTMGLTVSYASTMVIMLIVLVRTACELEANIVSVERISEYTDVASEAPAIIEGRRPAEGWPQEGIITFNEYETRYREGLDLVLKGLTCEIYKEEKIGIVGRTGAGKSSLALALFRIIEPTNGTIIIDNIDTSKIGLADLRSKLTIIPQDPVLFSGTLRMNLDPFEKYSDNAVWQALEHSHLKSFVSTLPNGLQHEINEGGENLSVGQRQLVCLARALLRKTKVLVLDEATAAVDLETDDLIQATIRKEFADCTVITIAHRLNTIMDSTRIMVLDQGKIKEFDSPINLLNNTSTIFYSLAKDAGLDWSVVWETDNPDFTDCFQKTVLIWIPCGFLWICLPFEIYSVKKHRRRCIPWSPLNSMKLVNFEFLFKCFDLGRDVLLGIRERMDGCRFRQLLFKFHKKSHFYVLDHVNIISPHKRPKIFGGSISILAFVNPFCNCYFSYIYDLRAEQSTIKIISNAQFVIFVIILQDEVLPAPSIFLFVCCVVSYPLIVVQLLLSTISDKLSPESTDGKNECPIVNATLLSCYFFSWFDKMAYLGFRRPLTKDDLWDLLPQYRCSYNFPNYHKNWQLISKKQTLAGKTPSPSVLFALGRTFWIPFILTGLTQLGANTTDFTTPFALRFLIDFVSSDEPSWRGYFYCCLIMFMGIIAAFFYTQQYWIAFRMGMQLRASIISEIYRKALRMNSNIKSSSSTGEIVNLMSIDTEHLHDVIPEFHTCWVGILQISVCFYLLWNELGISTLASLATLGLMIPINGYIASRLQQVQIKQMKFKDHRVKLMNEILAGIKVLKLYAWENSFGFQLSAVRNKELQMLKKNAYLTAVVEFMFVNLPILVALSTFVTYILIDENNVLDAKKVFVSISLFNIIHYPLIIVPMMIVGVVQALVSTTRLNKFLNQEELDPHAVSHNIAAKNAIDIENGTFSWTSDGDPILSNINITCPPGHLMAVLGPVGCGKSSLLSAVLGEMEKRNGHLNTKGTIAYVAQQAWIQNVTLRDNITFGLEYDKQRYDKVIEACALTPDLELLPAGDQTEIGERGINLSGGQKQRVSLARAVYSNADIILLDDPLSAVDSHSRLFITNSIAHLQQVDIIVALDKGQVAEIGSYDQLLQNKGAFAEFLLNYLSEHDAALLNKDELTNLGCIREEVARLTSVESDSLGPSRPPPKSPGVRSFTSDVGDSSMPFSFTKRMSRSLSQESHVYKRHLSQDNSKPEKSFSEQQNTANIIELETSETGQVSRQIYMKYFRAVGLSVIIVCFAAFALSTSCGVAANTWLSVWSQDPPTSTMDLRIQRLTVYSVLGISQVTLLLIGCLALANGSVRASRNLHNSMLNNILRCPLSFFDKTPLGRILNRFSKDMDLVDGELAQNIYPMLGTFLETIAIIIVVTMSTPLILSVILPVFVIYYFVQRFYISSSRQLKRLSFISHSPIFSHFSETLFGTSTIRAYNRTADFSRENERLVDEYHKCDFPSLAANRWLDLRLQLLGSIVSVFAALLAVIAKDTVDPGTMGLTVSYASTMVVMLIVLVRTTCELEANIVSVERISEYTDVATEAPAIIESSRPAEGWPQEGIITFNEYETRYREGLDLVLKGLMCEIYKEEKIGIVGRTGAGKSSLALALFRIIEPTNGTIIIDNFDTSKIGLADLRSKLTIIPQDPVLFSGTLRMNLDPFEKYSDNAVWQALEHSHLKSFVSTLPNGLQHEINEGGENLSVGQRQLVCLARALLRKTKVLVLDEATAAVDLETDDLIQATIRKEFADCTVITIAHRLNTITDSTRIMVLDQGKIKEFDSPINLLNNTSTIFYSLAKDTGLDWYVVWETDNPDFTDCFQKTVLIWIPCGFLWICFPFDVTSVKKYKRRIPWSALNLSKLAFATILLLYHRLKGQRSSGVLFIFWFLLTFSATITFRTFIISEMNDGKNSSISRLLSVCCFTSCPLIVLQLVLSTISEKISVEHTKGKNECPVVDATLLSRYLFSWFDKMCYLGFRRTLTKDDLWDLLDHYRCSYIFSKFHKNWKIVARKQSMANKTPCILSALGRTFYLPFILIGLVQFGATVTDFTSPFVLRLLINFVRSDEPQWRGYLYCCIILIKEFPSAFFYSRQYWIAFKLGLRLRASVISAIYRKAIRLNSNIKNSSSTGEIVNLMSIDTEQLNNILPEIHTCWVGLLKICAAFYLLWQELGVSVLASMAAFLLIIPINGYIARRLQRVQVKQMRFKDQRVKLMNEILAGIKILKLYAWEKSFGSQLSGVRNKELMMLKKNAYLTAVIEFMFGTLPVLVALSAFISYTLIDANNILDAKKVFVSITLFHIIHYPLISVPTIIVQVLQTQVSIGRLNKFLNQAELDPNAVSRDTASKNTIDIKNGTFAWASDSKPILNGINLTCPPGHLVAVLGPVGCGKSSLLSAVLGEMEKRSGHVNMKGTIAYVAQQAWIQNITLRDNIRFGSVYDKRRYEKVIEACALKPDLELLPAGDQTEIGERGINLSGGQKQRVSLARAVYSDADIILLDDPLSAVDSHVGKHIFDHVIGPNGLLRKKTRLFITHGIAHLQQVDTIVVLDKGEVTEVGSYNELIQNKGAFAEFLLNYVTEHNVALLNDEELITLECIKEEVARLTNAEIESSLNQRNSQKVIQESPFFDSKPKKSFTEVQKIIELETAKTGQIKISIYMEYFRAVGLGNISVCLTAFVLSTSCGVGANTWLSLWTQDPTSTTGDLRIQRLTVYGALGIGQVILLLIACLALANGSIRASRNLHNSMLTNILRCPLSFFETTPLGRILNRFSKDIDLVDGRLAQNIYPMLSTFLKTVAIIVVMTMSTPLVLCAIVPVFILYYLVQRFYIASSRQLKRLASISQSPIFSNFTETLYGTSTIRAYNRTGDFIKENEKLLDEYHKCAYPSLASNRWLGIRLQLLGTLVTFSAALFAVIAKDTIDPGTMGLTFSYASTMVITLIYLVRTSCELEANIVSVERISEYTKVASEAPAIVIGKRPAGEWPQEGGIAFNEYETRYREGLDLVLKRLTCEIYKEEKIGIVGRTGAGKSSLALALFRIIEPTNGTIIIDNIDTSKIGLADLRSKLTIIPQDPVLFSGTLRMNLDPFEKYSDNAVWQALEHSHLKSFVSTLPNGLQHEINEGGENLSVGQRQLVCLARALLRKTKVLVLDEATAAVDLETDDLIQATIRKEFADCTVITIAHRLNTIMDSTRIMVLDQGEIKEFDSPTNLLNNKNTLFYSLAKDAGLV